MINLGQIAAQTDQRGTTEQSAEEISKNFEKEALFVEKIREIAKSLSSTLESQALTYGSPKQREICTIKENEVELYTKTKEKIIIKIKELFGESCSIYLSPKVTVLSNSCGEFIEPCINMTWDGINRKDTSSEFGFVEEPDYYGGLGRKK